MRAVEGGCWVAVVPTLSDVIRGVKYTRVYLCKESTYLEALLDEKIARGLRSVVAFESLQDALAHPFYGNHRGPAIEVTAVGEIVFDGRKKDGKSPSSSSE